MGHHGAWPRTPPLRSRSTSPIRVSLAAVLVLSHLAVAVLGGVLGYLLRRPPERRSSLELRAPGAERRGAGRHRRR